MAGLTGKVLLINHGAMLMTNTLVATLKKAGIDTVHVEPRIEAIQFEKEGADAVVLFVGDYVYGSSDLLSYLKDFCFNTDTPLCVVGYEKELAEMEELISRSLIACEFKRPIDVKNLSAELQTIVRKENLNRKKQHHILLVDDDITFLQMMQEWLGSRYQVTAARSGMQAISYIAGHTSDLILLDYDMPVTSGPQILEMLRSEPNSAKIPVIFLTGKNDRESVMNVMRLKPEGYLLKSISKNELLEAVAHFFDTRKWDSLLSEF